GVEPHAGEILVAEPRRRGIFSAGETEAQQEQRARHGRPFAGGGTITAMSLRKALLPLLLLAFAANAEERKDGREKAPASAPRGGKKKQPVKPRSVPMTAPPERVRTAMGAVDRGG